MDDFQALRRLPIPPPRFDENVPVPPPQECGEPLVDLTGASPRLQYAASYRSRGVPHAPARCWLRKTAAAMLVQAAEALPPGWSLLVYDSLRPLAVQQALYDEFRERLRKQHPDYTEQQLAEAIDGFVALPRRDFLRPAPHTTGGAVDLTLCRQGEPVPMGTGFDDFSPRAATRFLEEHPQDEAGQAALENRRLLYHFLTRRGFVNYKGEWWHFSYGDRAWARQKETTPCYGFLDLEGRGDIW